MSWTASSAISVDNSCLSIDLAPALGSPYTARAFKATGPQRMFARDPATRRLAARILTAQAATTIVIAALCLVFAGRTADDWNWLKELAPWLDAMNMIDGKAAVYVCKHYTCMAPVTGAAELRALLK